MNVRLIAGALAATLIAASPALAGKMTDTSKEAMKRLLDLVISHNEGVVAADTGELAAGQSVSIPFTGDHTIEYYANAVCDNDCGNLDLIMRDAEGAELDVDDADDNAPVLNIMADVYPSDDDVKGEPRPMTLEIRMIACATETCAYAWRITSAD